MSDHREAVWLSLIAGLTSVLEDLIHDLSPDGAVLEAARATAVARISNLEPPETPLDHQAAVTTSALELFEEVFLTSLAKAIVRQSQMTGRTALRVAPDESERLRRVQMNLRRATRRRREQ